MQGWTRFPQGDVVGVPNEVGWGGRSLDRSQSIWTPAENVETDYEKMAKEKWLCIAPTWLTC